MSWLNELRSGCIPGIHLLRLRQTRGLGPLCSSLAGMQLCLCHLQLACQGLALTALFGQSLRGARGKRRKRNRRRVGNHLAWSFFGGPAPLFDTSKACQAGNHSAQHRALWLALRDLKMGVVTMVNENWLTGERPTFCQWSSAASASPCSWSASPDKQMAVQIVVAKCLV